MENVNFKLVTANDGELFEQRMTSFVGSLDRSAVIVEVAFSTAPLANGEVEYSALVRFGQTERWS